MAPVWHRVEEDRARRLRRRPSRPGRRARPGRLRGTTDHPAPPPAVAPAGGVDAPIRARWWGTDRPVRAHRLLRTERLGNHARTAPPRLAGGPSAGPAPPRWGGIRRLGGGVRIPLGRP